MFYWSENCWFFKSPKTYVMKPYLPLLICLLFSINLFGQVNIAPIPGWKMDVSNGHYSFTPPAGNGSYGFKYEIFPPANNKGDLMEWLKTVTIQDLRTSGYSAPLPGEPQEAKDIQTLTTYSVIVQDASKRKIAAMYFAYLRPDHTIRYGKVMRLREYSGNYINIAATHFVSLVKQEALTQNSANGAIASAPQQNTSASQSMPQMSGKGMSSADIKGIVLHSESSYGVGGMLIFIYKPYILFNNGSLYEHPEVSPNDLNVTQSRQSEPEKWGTWKLNGKTLTIVHGSKNVPTGKSNNWTGGWTWAAPAKKGEKLTATYGSISGGGNTAVGGGSITVSSKYITFNNQGQFTYETVGGGSYHDNSGGVSAYSARNTAGTYLLDGYSIEFRFNNGKVQRQCFYFYNEGDKEIFGIGNRPYTISK